MAQIMCRRIRQARSGNGKTEITCKTKTKAVQVFSNYIPRYFPYTSFTCVEDLISLHVLHLTQGSMTRDETKGDKREFQK
jgi:hypothetical protein